MNPKKKRGYGKALGEAVKQAVDDPNYEPPPRRPTWLTTWIDPVSRRERFRRWLSSWLKGALRDVPSDVSARYFEEMADDIRQLDQAQAVDRLIDKVAPKLLPNEPRDQRRSKLDRYL